MKQLNIVPALSAGRSQDGGVVLPRKFVHGLAELKRYWQGSMTVYMVQGQSTSSNLDDFTWLPGELPCEVLVLPRPELEKAIIANAGSVVLLSLDDFHQSEFWAACRRNGIPCAYISEYSLQTRQQIITSTVTNPLRRLRQRFWEWQQEKKRRIAVRGATGLQCNGTPTFNAYRSLSPDALLYFDTRVYATMLATEADIQNRHRAIRGDSSQPLRLLFSGRLTRMKGVMDLIVVAKALRLRGTNFHLSICGDGDLKDELSRRILKESLTEHVSLDGVLDFETELVPLAKNSVDLFICCHPQGDPSCTYLETMSCGVPIAGYANEALEGIVKVSGAGWVVPINQPEALAAEVIRIQKQPDELLQMSRRALSFAREHTFESTFQKRVDHLRSLAYQPHG